jgi:hypothetical protein
MARLMVFLLHWLMQVFSKKSSPVNPANAKDCCFVSGIWYYPAVAGSGGFMLNNPPFSSRGNNTKKDDDNEKIFISIAEIATAWWPFEIVEDTTACLYPGDRLRQGNIGRLCWSNSDNETWGQLWWED